MRKKAEKNSAETWAPALPLKIILAASPFCAGLFYEFTSCLAAVALMVYLTVCRHKAGKLRLYMSPSMLFSFALEGFLLLSFIWAEDRGSVAFGLLKFLPLPLFALSLGQIKKEDRESLLSLLPCSACLMTVLSLLLGMIPSISGFIYVSGGLSGFFQYPNTFAVYLLTALILILSRTGEYPAGETKGAKLRSLLPYVAAVILLGGIGLSKSRAVLAIAFAALAVLFFTVDGKSSGRIPAGICALALLLGGSVYLLVSGSAGDVFSSSTLLGRLLYWKDALGVIVRRPLGLGYLGYFRLQGSFQTGVYSVMHVHNDLLQTFLDAGWIPGALLVWTALNAFLKAESPSKKIIIAALALHALFDFDLQFISMGFICLTLCPFEESSAIRPADAKWLPALYAVLAAACVWTGASNYLSYAGFSGKALEICPFNTSALIQELEKAGNAAELESAGKRVTDYCPDVSQAWSARARAAFSDGKVQEMIVYKRKAILLNRYSKQDYDDYRSMLEYCRGLYEATDPTGGGAEVCDGQLEWIDSQLQTVLDSTDPLAWLLNDKPELEISD